MKKLVIILALVAVLIGGVFSASVSANPHVKLAGSDSASAITCNMEPCASCPQNTAENIAGIGMSNPAAMYCKEMGYEYKVVSTEEGERGVVVLPNGKECDEWDFYEGRCGQEFSYCAKQGWLIAPKGKRDNFANECVTCVMPDGAQKSVSELLDLEAKINIGTIVANKATMGIDTVLDTNDMEQVVSLPTHFDWRNNGGDWTTPVKDQGNCGSCWAFSAVGATEPQFNISSGNPDLDLNLSEQYLVSNCCVNCGSCSGGWHDTALAFIRDSGITDETCFPYIAQNCPCSNKCLDWESRLERIDETARVPNNIEAIKQYLIDKGPLSVAMGVGSGVGGGFDSNGIYTCNIDNSINHAVVIVGYDEANNYWIVRNSWGDTWNRDGYFNVGYGECGIENYVYYAYIADTNVIEADFYGEPTNGYIRLDVTFIDQSNSSDGIHTWAWNFGDGNTSNQQNPVHAYEQAGVYTVSLTVSDVNGNSDTETKTDYITVSEVVDFVDQVATGEVNVAGSMSGSYLDTQSNGEPVEAITERQSGGKPSTRYSYLEHKWLFDVQEGTAAIFNGNMWAPASSDGDGFVFSYSTDDDSYVDMFTVTATQNDESYQTFTFPPFTSGTVYIRATDTDRNKGHLELNTLYVDHMFIHTMFVGNPPSAPTNLAATTSSSSSIDLTWDDNADNENGFKIERSTDGSDGWASIGIVALDTESYTDTGLEAATTYYYRVLAFKDYVGYSTYSTSNVASATTNMGILYVCDLGDASNLTKRNRWNAVVIITVKDGEDSPVEGATVIGSWSAGATGSSSGTTDNLGQCRITKGNLGSNVNSVTFAVEDVTLTGYTYVADDEDIIILYKP